MVQSSLKKNIIDEKVNKYIEKIKNNFSTNIIINTKIIKEENINYNSASERAIYNKAKILFSKIGKKTFCNNSEIIYVSNNDIKESIDKTIKNPYQKKYLKENIAVFAKLDKIIESAKVLSYSSNDLKGRVEYKEYKYYVVNILIDNKKYVVEFDTRIQNTNGKNERHFRLERIYPI